VLPAQAAAETVRLPDSGVAQAVPFADDVSTLLRNGKYRKASSGRRTKALIRR